MTDWDRDEWKAPKTAKRTRTSECSIHCTDSTDLLRKAESLELWKRLVAAATVLQHTGILEIARNLPEDEIGDVLYHHRCRSTFLLRSLRQGASTSRHSPGSQSLPVRAFSS